MKIQAFRQIESTLTQNDIRLVFISNSTPYNYRIVRLTHAVEGRFRTVPIVSGLRKYGMKGVTEGIKLGYETGHLAGDSWQQGGTVILDTEANIKYVHVEEHPADWPDMEKVLPLIGIQNTSIDYKKAVSDC
ncbi:Hypothetical predicted protein [Mytilus galloprovincialis]|uniref:Uncharacterized protein n=1 Tax=Mytilus galloprovincialis TaxID=29158 RepID=A0A8B6EXT1_MYTGA|nr:Hypothetical predicted protein [Mytilus galloprovincialis]